MHRLNPYQSPAVVEVAPAQEPSGKAFRWRIIPVTLLLIYGGCVVLGTALVTVSGALRIARHSDYAEYGIGPTPWELSGFCATGLGCGVLLILSAVSLWRTRWWIAGLAFALAVLSAYVGKFFDTYS